MVSLVHDVGICGICGVCGWYLCICGWYLYMVSVSGVGGICCICCIAGLYLWYLCVVFVASVGGICVYAGGTANTGGIYTWCLLRLCG